MSDLNFLQELEALIAERLERAPEGSYTARLAASGPAKIAQKVGEEGVELALAAVGEDDGRVTAEAADLLYHVIVLLRARGLSLADVVRELEARHRDAPARPADRSAHGGVARGGGTGGGGAGGGGTGSRGTGSGAGST